MELKDLLGGYNCGGCGYENCEECAKAIENGECDASICMLLEDGNMEKIEKLLKELKQAKENK